MIPKKIHYCWFGKGPKNKLFYKCLKSWKKNFPDYEIIEWNEYNFDINESEFTKKAYEMKKYAFVSDYARLKVLYDNGGIYFDTDVEVLKRIPDDILQNGYFAKENNKQIATGLGFAVQPYNRSIKIMLDDYINYDFSKMEPCPIFNTNSLLKNGIDPSTTDSIDGVGIYSKEYFCGYDLNNNHYAITENTYTVHHYDSSWKSKGERRKNKIKKMISKIIGINNYEKIRRLKNKI